MKKCVYEKAIILIRNPFYALIAEFNRQMSGSKTEEIDPGLFQGLGKLKAWNRSQDMHLKRINYRIMSRIVEFN